VLRNTLAGSKTVVSTSRDATVSRTNLLEGCQYNVQRTIQFLE